MHLLPSLLEGGGGGGRLNHLPNFSKGGLDRTSAFRRELVKKTRVTFFRGVGFYKKDKVNLKYLMTKKVSKQIFFSVLTKNSNWEILTKNLVAFKRSDVVKDGKP